MTGTVALSDRRALRIRPGTFLESSAKARQLFSLYFQQNTAIALLLRRTFQFYDNNECETARRSDLGAGRGK